MGYKTTRAQLKRQHRAMTAAEYHELIDHLGWSVYRSAKELGISLRTAQRYAAGERPIREPVARLLRALDQAHAISRAGSSTK